MIVFGRKALLLYILFPVVCLAQTEFVPLKKDPIKEKYLTDAIKNRYKTDVDRLSGSNKRYIADLYKERYEFIQETFEANAVIVDKEAYPYLSALVHEILKVNPQFDSSELRILFLKAWWPNASSMGEGTIFFNISLFHRLDNESQAAFVICHELAHYYLNHGNNSISTYVNTIYSDEFQKKLKAIQKADYKQNQLLKDLARTITFKSRRHSREFEHAADSLAIEFMKNTGYDLNEALTCLALLDSVDRSKYDSKLQLESRFNFSSFPFKTSWLESSSLTFTNSTEYNSREKDSLKTHPDCKVRIENLRTPIAKYSKPKNKKFLVSEQQFQHFKQQFDYELLNYCFENKELSRCLYYTLQMLNAQPNNAWLHCMVSKCFNEIYATENA